MKLANALRVPKGKVSLSAINPSGTPEIRERTEAEAKTAELVQTLGDLQMRLFVNGSRALLVVLQGMDTSGKDGAVRHVFGRVNPAGVSVTSFKQPTPLELRHDFLWRAHAAVPPFGDIGVFNRSYYEDVLVVRVHADTLLLEEMQRQKDLWQFRFDMINRFEELLVRDCVTVVKFFLHISKDEQRDRLIARQQNPKKHWKLCRADIKERAYWDDYQHAYEELLQYTNTAAAPWYIIPANNKWYRDYAISSILTGILDDMELPAPKLEDKELLEMVIR